MGDSVEVVTSELHVAADRLSGAGQRLQDGLSSVDLETGNLLGSGWKGEAATAFEKYWDQWHNGAGQVVRALQTMSDALEAAAKNYEAADEQAGGALDSTMSGSGGSGTGGGGGSTTGAGTGSGDGAPTSSGTGAPSGTGSGSGAGGAQQQSGLAEQMNLGQTMAPLSQAAGIPGQFAGQVAGGLMQAGTMAAGAAQQAVQLATQMAQQAEAAAAEAQQAQEAQETESAEKPADAPAGAEGDEAPAGPAPVDTPREGPAKSGSESPTAREL
jgi:WXG100 family type VII secretion target